MAPQLEAAAESKVSTPARSSPPPAHSLLAVARLHRSAMIPLTGGLPFFRRSVTMSAFVCVCVRVHTLHMHTRCTSRRFTEINKLDDGM